jgi:hypothetical protein
MTRLTAQELAELEAKNRRKSSLPPDDRVQGEKADDHQGDHGQDAYCDPSCFRPLIVRHIVDLPDRSIAVLCKPFSSIE